MATQRAAIGALYRIVRLLPRERYLWDFSTVPTWCGRGVYPRLLRAIVDAARFWNGCDEPTLASARGVAKAGFEIVVNIVQLDDGRLVLMAVAARERMQVAARILGLPIDESLSEPARSDVPR